MNDEIRAATIDANRDNAIVPTDFWELGKFTKEFAQAEAMRYSMWAHTFVAESLLPTEARAVEYLKRASALIEWLTSPTTQPTAREPIGSCDKHPQCAGRKGHAGECMFLGCA